MPALRRLPSPAGLIVALALIAAMPPQAGLACGYHDDVTLARVGLSWSYPDALHVQGAIALATMNRQLPAPTFAPDPFGMEYRKTARSLEALASKLNEAPAPSELTISLVLIEPMLWARYVVAADMIDVRIHSGGPQSEDLVIVTGQDVIREIVAERLSLAQALKLGLVRHYGKPGQVDAFVTAYGRIGEFTAQSGAVSRREPAGAKDDYPTCGPHHSVVWSGSKPVGTED